MGTYRYSLPQITSGQASAEIPHNDALNYIDMLTSVSIKDRDLSAPPGSPTNGDLYLVKATGTGAWTGKDGMLAGYYDGWIFATVRKGMVIWIEDEAILVAMKNS